MALESSISESVTLIIFPHNRKDLVKSSMVMKTLNGFSEEEGELVVVGGNFSIESIEVLNQYRSHVLNLSEFPWREDSYNEIKSGVPSERNNP